MDKLKIIFANRKDCFDKPGGDTVQMMKTKEYLEKLYPIEIKICLTPDEITQDNEAKIVHIFNLETINETNAFIYASKKKNKKVVLSTIHWNFLDNYYVKYLEALNLPPLQTHKLIKILIIKLFNLLIILIPMLKNKYANYIDKGLYCTKKYKKERIKALKNADILLPNSDEEMELCAKDFNLNLDYIKEKSFVVPNATTFNTFIDNKNNIDIKLPDKYVIIIGRIDSTKNQYNIVKALYKYKYIGIVIVGSPYSSTTYKRLKKLAEKRGNVFIIPQTPQKDLVYLYKNAFCHCLPSFYDTTGLVNLESLLCGTPIITSNENYCPVKFYEFDKYGKTCNPYDTKSIRDAILYFYNNPQKVEICDEYKTKISYENVAKLTFEAYKKVLV